jgi:hypothetical protein
MPMAPIFSGLGLLNNYFMKTARFIKSLVVILLMAIASPSFASISEPVVANSTTETPEAKLARLQERIEEINAMDKNSLSRGERKALKKEVRQIKDEVKALSGGVYISIGALLIIILLLILLL